MTEGPRAGLPRAIVFDLFGTLVSFDDSRVPRRLLRGRPMPVTIDGLGELLRSLVPGSSEEDFLVAVARASAAIGEEKRRLGIEVSTRVRFERALAEVGAGASSIREGAEEMARRHMDTLASTVLCPPSRASDLAALSGRFRLALLSNFDHAPTARRVLAEGGLDTFLEVIVISEEAGLRKPVPAIFHLVSDGLGLAPGECLFVGDNPVEDIAGAAGAGMRPVWVRGSASGPRPEQAEGEVGDVRELGAWLEDRQDPR